MTKFLKYWLSVILWAAFIFYLSSKPGLSSGMPVFYDVFVRKIAHATIFGILFLLIFRAFYSGHGFSLKKALVYGLILAVLYAFSDEAHQYFVPEREARLKDVAIDSLGIVLTSCGAIYYKIKK